jgi:hypothetical protein
LLFPAEQARIVQLLVERVAGAAPFKVLAGCPQRARGHREAATVFDVGLCSDPNNSSEVVVYAWSIIE